MNVRYRKKIVCILLMTVLSISGCGQASTAGNAQNTVTLQTTEESDRVDTGFVVTDPDSYDSADTAVLVDINSADNNVTLLNLDLGKQ